MKKQIKINTMVIESMDDFFPKTLEIRNEVGGMIWLTYHVNNFMEAIIIAKNSQNKGYENYTLVDYNNEEENYPDWRDQCDGELKNVLSILNNQF